MQGFVPNVLSIAGLDPSGGAGVLADIKVIAAMGAHGMGVITALTVQNTLGVQAVHTLPTAHIAAQLHALFNDGPIHAVKIGMLGSASMAQCIADILAQYHPRIVVLDPVIHASSGAALITDDNKPYANDIAHYFAPLLPMVTVLTPNLPESQQLLPAVNAFEQPIECAQQLQRQLLPQAAVLLKGGHLHEAMLQDILVTPTYTRHFTHPRQIVHHTHGTGCTLSSALATQLAFGLSLSDACTNAIAYTQQAIAQAPTLSVGQGRGPLHHFHAFWPMR